VVVDQRCAHDMKFFAARETGRASSLSDFGCRGEKSAERGQILPDLLRQYRDIDQKAGEICAAQVILQPTIPKSDRLLGQSVPQSECKHIPKPLPQRVHATKLLLQP